MCDDCEGKFKTAETIHVHPIEVNVQVLKLQPGDVLVAQIPESYGDHDGEIANELGKAFERALKNAGHGFDVGAVYTVGGQLELRIVRPDNTEG